jgi:RNA polymerase primary sigma factor
MVNTGTSKRRSVRSTNLSKEQLDVLRQRVREMLNHEIDFIPSQDFRTVTAAEEILNGKVDPAPHSSVASAPRDFPAHLARLCETQLLTADQERELFRLMNYCKFRANAIRTQLDPDRPDAELLQEAESFLRHARQARDHIVTANMRLVVAVVKKFVSPRHSFDDLLSDGIASMMQAVEKFDFGRGFRFSTYAYRAIARNAYRKIHDQQKETARFALGGSDSLTEIEQHSDSSMLDEKTWTRMRTLLGGMLDQLDRRERFIIRGRYALGSHRKVRTFQSLADKLGVSKERVRQLEQRAVSKLRAMAADSMLDDFVEPSFG